METWRPVVGDARYEVSSEGRVRSLLRGGRILRQTIASHGYPTVSVGRRRRNLPVHVFVAEAFLGPRPNGHVVRHKNDVKSDNRAENLCYGTHSDNRFDSYRNGSYDPEERKANCHRMQRIRWGRDVQL